MCSQIRNSCAKAFDNRSRSKNLKPKKSKGGGQFDPPLKASRVKQIYAVNKKGVSCRKQGVLWTKIARLFNCSEFSCLLLHLIQKGKFLCSNKVRAILRSLVLLVRRDMRRRQNFSEKKIHKALRSVQSLASFITFNLKYYPIFVCGEKIIRLASNISVKFDEKSARDF